MRQVSKPLKTIYIKILENLFYLYIASGILVKGGRLEPANAAAGTGHRELVWSVMKERWKQDSVAHNLMLQKQATRTASADDFITLYLLENYRDIWSFL